MAFRSRGLRGNITNIYVRMWRGNTSPWVSRLVNSHCVFTVAGGWWIYSETAVSETAGPHTSNWASVLWCKVHFMPSSNYINMYLRHWITHLLTWKPKLASSWLQPLFSTRVNEKSQMRDHLCLIPLIICCCLFEVYVCVHMRVRAVFP